MLPDLSAIAPGIYRIDLDKSRIDFTTTHWFGLGNVSGSLTLTSGDLIVAERVEDSSVRAVASTASFSSNNSRRDAQIRSRTFLDAERHPDLLFASTSIVLAGDTATIYGNLTVKGNHERAIFSVSRIEGRDGTITAVATATVDRHEHGIHAMAGIAGRYLHITVQFAARFDERSASVS
jgi:polyisoprenoid-binding protein YceI